MIGTTISHYKILEKLGEGGMGVVYKAQDTKLDRTVALKFLPEHVSSSEKDTARFIQEAQAAASLNHPNICTIHGIEESDGKHFIVMEFVDGQTLQAKTVGAIHESPLPVKKAIEIGIQIAEGLAAAHEKGIVHRDIKPENVMIRKDGRVQIMDFGLAKLRGASRLTKEGSTVGTAGYMSPEQVQGLDTDHRTDIFSLGVILYELLAGQSPFKGVHETAIAYEIVNVDSPPLSSVNPEIPPELDAIVLECLEKDPNERAQSAKQIAIDLKRYRRESSRQHASRIMPARALSAPSVTAAPSASASTSPMSVRKPVWIVAPLIVGVVLGWLIFRLGSTTAENEPRFVNVSTIAAAGQRIFTIDIPTFAFSPDGRFIAYTVIESGSTRILLRALSSFQVTPIKGTENGTAPFFSPDGKWIGFVADGKIKKVPLTGGTAEAIADAPGFRGASWGSDNRIVYSPEFSAGLMSMSATGGDVRVLSRLDTTTRERTHRWPQVLHDGKSVLYTIGDQNNPNSYIDAQLAIQSLETGERHILDVRGEMAVYVEPGYLVVARNGVLLAAPFSLKERRITQPLATIINDVGGDPGSGVVHFSVSATGDLLYLPSTANRELGLVWMTREGQMTPLNLPPGLYTTPRISPDGSRLAVSVGTPGSTDTDIWVYNFRTEAFNRITFERRMSNAIWSKDGKKLYYTSALGDMDGLMVKPVDGGTAGTLLLPKGGDPISISPRGNHLIFNSFGSAEGNIYELDLETGQHKTLIATPQFEYGGNISPDGKYLLYYSNESGSPEVFVRTYPDLKGKWQVSRNGGQLATWTPDGREILYINAVGRMMSVPVQRDPTFTPGVPRELFDITQMYTPNILLANWDITPDGKRFIFVRSTNINATVSMFNIVFNWRDELKRELSGKK